MGGSQLWCCLRSQAGAGAWQWARVWMFCPRRWTVRLPLLLLRCQIFSLLVVSCWWLDHQNATQVRVGVPCLVSVCGWRHAACPKVSGTFARFCLLGFLISTRSPIELAQSSTGIRNCLDWVAFLLQDSYRSPAFLIRWQRSWTSWSLCAWPKLRFNANMWNRSLEFWSGTQREHLGSGPGLALSTSCCTSHMRYRRNFQCSSLNNFVLCLVMTCQSGSLCQL